MWVGIECLPENPSPVIGECTGMPPIPSMTADHELLRRIARHDRAAFAEFYDRFAPRVFGLLVKLMRDRTEAEDVLQDVFLHVWRSADRYDEGLSHPIVWLMLIARARAVDAIRKRVSQTNLAVGFAALSGAHGLNGQNHSAGSNGSGNGYANGHATNGSANAHSAAHAGESRTVEVGQAMAALPAEQSDAIGLAYHGGLTCAQIAELRGVPVGTVKTRIRLGMIKLREAVDSGSRAFRTSEATT